MLDLGNKVKPEDMKCGARVMTPIDKAWVAGRTAPRDGAVRLVALLHEAGGSQSGPPLYRPPHM